MKRRKRRRGLLNIDSGLKEIARSMDIPGEIGRALPKPTQVRQERANNILNEESWTPEAKGRTQIWTHTTKAGSNLKLYEADTWMSIRVTLLEEGNVDIGTQEDLRPVLSGKGGSLVLGQEARFEINRGERIYITSDGAHRVRVMVSPIPFNEQWSLMGYILTALRKLGPL